ncbi:phosphonate C-P lyase system protein PhnG [uncultured Cohaesibacter sp.]|uniref:phosphonate C-P lyase system protein PhnG n=1 Tax=uncultured Cohaesibacter sp. TaxID=1002546 RepID=UPI00292F3F59|nr:phosphonate C-P lyase system protein PhnG [uncultured Cohaesibacter sp.]
MSISAQASGERSHQETLSILARADSHRLKSFAESLIAQFEDIEVVNNRSGLVMLPMRDTAQGTAFHLGEVLVSEAHITSRDAIGYGMRTGRDLEAAMAMAIIDLAIASNISKQDCRDFLDGEAQMLAAVDDAVLRKVEATRVDMETF